MADVFSKKKRSEVMSRIKGRDTEPERLVRSHLHRAGFRFRLHSKDLPGRPDVLLPRLRTAIFVHGCFWHGHVGCRFAVWPKTNAEFWRTKIESNRERDRRKRRELETAGWRVEELWECELQPDKLNRLVQKLSRRRPKA